MLTFKRLSPIYQPKGYSLKNYEQWLHVKKKIRALQQEQDMIHSSFQGQLADFINLLKLSSYLNETVVSKGYRGAVVQDTPILGLYEHLCEEKDLNPASLYQLLEFILKQLKLNHPELYQKVVCGWKLYLLGFQELSGLHKTISQELEHQQKLSLELTPLLWMLNQLQQAFVKALSFLTAKTHLVECCDELKKCDVLSASALLNVAKHLKSSDVQLQQLVQSHCDNIQAAHQNAASMQYEAQLLSLKHLLQDYLKQREQVKDDRGQIKEYFYGHFFAHFQKSYSQKKAAVQALLQVLNGESVSLGEHLSTLRNGHLGNALRTFIKQGHADMLVGKTVRTVSDFVAAMDGLVALNCQ